MNRRCSLIINLTLMGMLAAAGADACSCFDEGPFAQVALEPPVTLVGKILKHHGNSMDVAVQDVVRGQETRKQVTIWGDNGRQCRPYVDNFPEGSTWLLAVFVHDEKEDPRSPPADSPEPLSYVLSACGTYSLRVEEDMAVGRIRDSTRQAGTEELVPLQELVEWLKSGGKAVLAPMTRTRP